MLGACLNSRCSTLSESDSTFGHEQVFSSLEYRSNAAAAAECAGLRAERPCLAIYRRTGAGEPRSQGDHGQLCERAWAAAVRPADDGGASATWLCQWAVFVAADCEGLPRTE